MILYFTDGNPDEDDVSDDEDLMLPLSPAGEWKQQNKFNKSYKLIDILFSSI